ncbi:MAG: hypothetical protein Q9184_005380, partial [Pyrenodesmia sp. 2 TL-2023]
INESATNGFKALDADSAPRPLTKADLDDSFSPFDLKRLDSYANNMLDYHVIIDMVPQIAFLYFTSRLEVSLTGVQQSILLAIGLQRKVLEDVERELGLPVSQLLAMFVKIVRKVASHFRALVAGTVAQSLPAQMQEGERVDVDGGMEVKVGGREKQRDLEEELREGGEEVGRELREKQRALIDALPLDRYEIETGGPGWEDAEKQVQKAVKANGGNENMTVSVRSSKPASGKRKGESAEQVYAEEIGNKEAKRLKKGMKKSKQ